jgi:uncharacterized protein
MMLTADEIIRALDLKPHPEEGGFYRETYRSPESLQGDSLPVRYSSPRSLGTAIYYMLTPHSISALHRLPTDEIFHFYLGDPVEMLWLLPDGASHVITLGQDLLKGEMLQWVVPMGSWFGSHLKAGGRFALMGTTMAPGFEFADYEPGDQAALIAQYPGHESLIRSLTR